MDTERECWRPDCPCHDCERAREANEEANAAYEAELAAEHKEAAE